MYGFFRSFVMAILKSPEGPPEPPAGSHESVQTFRAAPAFLTYRLIMVAVGSVLALFFEAVGLVPAVAGVGPAVAIPLAAVVTALLAAGIFVFYAVVRLEYEMRYYIVTDRSLRIREGVVIVRETTITFANIQNMRIDQGPLQRAFGIYDLVVETAGGGAGVPGKPGGSGQALTPMHQGVFRGIGKPAELRDLILRFQRGTRSAGLGDRDEEFGPAGGATGAAHGREGFGPAEIAALRAIRAETAGLREALSA